MSTNITRVVIFWVVIGTLLVVIRFLSPYMTEALQFLAYLSLILIVSAYFVYSLLRKRKADRLGRGSLQEVEQALLHETDEHQEKKN